ncbi:MAG: efflux RND transporter permease subunit [Acidithiobacillus sp.]
MNLSAPFIRRPVATTVLAAAVIILGLFAYFQLPMALLPNVSFPTVLVTASLPGASPQTMSSAVATPLERQFSSIPGLQSMSAVSQNGATRITMQFSLSQSAIAATQEVSDAVAQAQHFLPPGMPQPPLVKNLNPSARPILYLSLSAPNMPLYQLDKYAQTQVATTVATVPGVANVQVFGAKTYAVRIYVNPFALAARGLTLQNVQAALGAANVNLPQGTIEGASHDLETQVHGQLHTAAAFNHLVLTYADGHPIPLSAVGKAENSTEYNQQETWINGQPGIVLAIVRQPGSNTVAISNQIRALLPQLIQAAPGGARLRVVFDNADYIRAAVQEVLFTLGLASLLVAGVMWVFLRRSSATLIGALAIPLSLLGTFLVMMVLGYSLNTLTLLALTLAVGFVVDDAVVMLENIHRHIDRGESGFTAALHGSREVGFTVLSMTLSLAIIFLPLMLMGGFVGHLFSAFGVTISVVILVSGLVSLTVTPMLCSRFLRHSAPGDSRFQRGFGWSRDVYVRSLQVALRHKGWVLGFAGLTLVGSLGLGIIVHKGFLPNQNSGTINANIQYPTGLSFAKIADEQQAIAQAIRANPDVLTVVSSAGQGPGAFGGMTSGHCFIRVKPADAPDTDRIITALRHATARFDNAQIVFQGPAGAQSGTANANGAYAYELTGQNWHALDTATTQLSTALRRLPQLQSVNTSLQTHNPEVSVAMNRPRATALGVTPEAIEQTLGLAFGGRQVGTIYGAADEYKVFLEIDPRYQNSINALNTLSVPGAGGTLVPLAAVADFRYDAGPLTLDQHDGLPSTTVSFNLAPGTSLGQATALVQKTARQVLPAGITGRFGGNAALFQSAFKTLPFLLVATILLIYVVLAILYEHFRHPLTILTALPLAAFGALLSLYVFGLPLDLYSFIGIIMLLGLVKKNGIILVDFAISRRREGATSMDAIVDACTIRYRPIMMTTFAAILGVLPIAIGFGAGAQTRVPLGVAVVGGLIFSQFLTLYVTPAFYLWMEALTARLRRREDLQEPSVFVHE